MGIDLTCIGLTGGIATGKSTCVSVIAKLLPETVVFDADVCVRELYAKPEVRKQLEQVFGPNIMASEGEVNRDVLRDVIFADASEKRKLEAIIHPLVREECLALMRKTATTFASRLFVADIPLLFENGFQFGQSVNLLVATSMETQIKRLKKRNGWSDDQAETIISAQMPIADKIPLADVVFWNEGPEIQLKNQCLRFLRSAICEPFSVKTR